MVCVFALSLCDCMCCYVCLVVTYCVMLFGLLLMSSCCVLVCACYAFVCFVCGLLCDVVWCARRCGVSFRDCVSSDEFVCLVCAWLVDVVCCNLSVLCLVLCLCACVCVMDVCPVWELLCDVVRGAVCCVVRDFVCD